jgi:hypothetical protein
MGNTTGLCGNTAGALQLDAQIPQLLTPSGLRGHWPP